MKRKLFNVLIMILLCVSKQFASTSSYTDWTEYPSDPVYNPGRAYYPSISYNANKFNDNSAFYKMWYQSASGIGLAYSSDGINWTTQTITGLPASAAHPDVVYDAGGFGGGAYDYKMWFWNSIEVTSISAIQFSQSTDGINWTAPVSISQDAGSPLVTGVSTGYFYQLYGPGDVIYNAGNTNPIAGQPLTYPYVMYFDTATEGFYGLGIEQLGLAYSQDGLFWTRYGTEPVLLPTGNSADWDGEYTYQPSIIQVDGLWHMYYSGSNGQPIGSDGNTTAHGIGYATSTDGINWVKDPTPIFYILDGVAWRNNRTYTPEVIFAPFCTSGSSSSFAKMWFTGANSSDVRAIGYATMPCPGPLAPASFTGIVKKNTFLNKTECVLFAQWPASTSSNVAYYRIYHNGVVVRTVDANSQLTFRGCNRCCKNAFTGYEISAVDNNGNESSLVPLTVTFC